MEEIKEKINKGLTIGRIPHKTYKWFVEFSKEEFSSDYGMALKHLVDVYKGVMPSGNEEIMFELERLQIEINKLKQQEQEVEEKPRGRLNGK